MVLGAHAIGGVAAGGGPTSVWAIVEAVGSAAGAFILALGGVVANRYGKRANLTIDARPFLRLEGRVGLNTRIHVRSVGLRRLRFREGTTAPYVDVVEVLDRPAQPELGVRYRKRATFLVGQLVEPGEELYATEPFYLPVPNPRLIGWGVEVTIFASRWFGVLGPWEWRDQIFVPYASRPRGVGVDPALDAPVGDSPQGLWGGIEGDVSEGRDARAD